MPPCISEYKGGVLFYLIAEFTFAEFTSAPIFDAFRSGKIKAD